MTYAQLLDRLISDGITEVRATYADPKDQHKRDGAIEGFEACRGKTPSELVALWHEAGRHEQQLFRHRHGDEDDQAVYVKTYWKQRYKTLQIEFVLNVVSVGLTQAGQAPLLGHLPTARGATKYAEIVGIDESRLS